MMSKSKNISSDIEIKKLFLFIGFLLVTILIFWLGFEFGWFEIFNNQEKMLIVIKKLGLIGPVVIIGLIAVAIVITPIPSAPLALVSGALYGHTFGTMYVVLGALSGSMIAFMIARKLGYDYISKTLHHRMPVKIIGSQNTLMLIVFVTRLAPFISFDVISYAAGLTRLTFGRFIIATLMGIIPISFVLAHLGSVIVIGESESIVYSVLILGIVMLVPILINMIVKKVN